MRPAFPVCVTVYRGSPIVFLSDGSVRLMRLTTESTPGGISLPAGVEWDELPPVPGTFADTPAPTWDSGVPVALDIAVRALTQDARNLDPVSAELLVGPIAELLEILNERVSLDE